MLPEPSSLTQWLHKGILPASQHTTVLSNVGAAKETNSQSEGSREESRKKKINGNQQRRMDSRDW
jgi:hypothetical protein